MAPRTEIIGDCTLILGDARDVVPTLAPVNCVVTDLPYRLTSGGSESGVLGGKFDKQVYSNSGEFVVCDVEFEEIMPLVANVLSHGHAYFMVNNRHVEKAIATSTAAGFHFHNLLVWDKSTGTPNRWYMKNCEFTVFASRGTAFKINDCGARQLIKCPNVMNAYHETEKPVALMEHYILNSTTEGDAVLDMFMGSGTTGVAVINLGRKFIGVEKLQKHFDHACRRIEAATKQVNMLVGLGSYTPLETLEIDL